MHNELQHPDTKSEVVYSDHVSVNSSAVRSDMRRTPGYMMQRQFLEAAQRQDIQMMMELLKQKVNVDCQVTEGHEDSVAKGYTALHLVGISGNINIARLLLGARANVNRQDYNGRTPLHIAAERDEAALVAILIEEGGDLAKLDYDGDNPMHLAIKATGERGDGAVDAVKVMVGQGADIESMDRNEHKPVAIALESGKHVIANYLKQREHGVRNPGRTIGQRLMDAGYALSFWGMFIVFNTTFFLLLIPAPPAVGLLELIYYILFVATAVSHLLSWHIDPGYLNRNPQAVKKCQDYKQLANSGHYERSQKQPPPIGKDVIRVCPSCDILKPRRSKHCTICRLCVDRFDHHCPWINNCVGQGNHRIFMVFLTSLMLLLLYLSVCCFYAIISTDGFGGEERGTLPFIALPFWNATESPTSQSEAFFIQYFGCDVAGPCASHRWVVCGMAVLFLIMGGRLSWMWWEQAARVSKNITTYEENSPWRFPYISHRAPPNDETPRLSNDFDKGSCWTNCLVFWNCGSCEGPGKGVENTVQYYMYQMLVEMGIYLDDAVEDFPNGAQQNSNGSRRQQPGALTQPLMGGQDMPV